MCARVEYLYKQQRHKMWLIDSVCRAVAKWRSMATASAHLCFFLLAFSLLLFLLPGMCSRQLAVFSDERGGGSDRGKK